MTSMGIDSQASVPQQCMRGRHRSRHITKPYWLPAACMGPANYRLCARKHPAFKHAVGGTPLPLMITTTTQGDVHVVEISHLDAGCCHSQFRRDSTGSWSLAWSQNSELTCSTSTSASVVRLGEVRMWSSTWELPWNT